MKRLLVLLMSILMIAPQAWSRNITKQLTCPTSSGTSSCTTANLEDLTVVDATIVFTDTTPDGGETFRSGAAEGQTITFETKSNTDHQDYVVFYDSTGASWAVALTKPVAEVDTLNFPTKANAIDGDYVKIFDGSGVGWALALDTTGGAAHTPTGAVWTALAAGKKSYCDVSGATTAAQVAAAVELCLNALTGFTAAITTNDGAADGHMSLTMAVKAPVTDPVPHNREDAGDPTKVITFDQTPQAGQYKIQFNGGTKTGFIAWDASAGTVQTALRLVTGLEAATVSGSNSTGYTITYVGVDGTPALAVTDSTLAVAGVTEVEHYLLAPPPDAGHYKILYGATKTGFIEFDDDEATIQAALRLITGLGSITVDLYDEFDGTGPRITFTGVVGNVTEISITDNNMTSGGPDVIATVTTDTEGTSTSVVATVSNGTAGSAAGTITGVQTTAGVASTAPAGAAYTAVNSARKTLCDISAATTAASVAAAVELCVDAMTGLSAVITTDDSAADGTMLFTQVVNGATTDPAPHNADDSGAGGITGTATTPGSVTDIDLTANTIFIDEHNYPTALKVTLTTSDTLPTGFAALTAYYVIVVDRDYIKLASSKANALAGTEVNITGYGVGTQTVVVNQTVAGAVKLQKNDAPIGATPIWIDVPSSSQNMSTTTHLNWALDGVGYREVKPVISGTSGAVSAVLQLNAKD